MFIINMAEYLFPLLQVHIKGNYGYLRLTKKQYEYKENGISSKIRKELNTGNQDHFLWCFTLRPS